jgi:serine/threonine protein kinase
VIVCLSKQFNQAGFRQKEVRLALDTAMEQPEGEIFIIPARLEECDNLESLRKWHWVDLFEGDGYEILMRAFRARADKIGAILKVKKNLPPKINNVKVETKGFSVGRYQVLEKIGEGGMATVYKAFDSRLETNVSVKLIRTERVPPNMLERSLKRFKSEVKALARLHHPNIVTIIDYGEQDGKPYLVMPYLPGGTLKQRMGMPMPWREAIQLLLPVSLALDYIHNQGIIHRHLKPSNLLFTQNGQSLLIDFDISMVFNLGRVEEFMAKGIIIGTAEYMAPEQIIDSKVDYRADVYALGIILYYMITGRKPFTDDTPMPVEIKQLSAPLPRPQMFVRDLPDKVDMVLWKALAKNPDDRYGDMAAFTSAMQGLLD